uniref:Uncharacterized protein n=1 Tax=Oryza sativa subsp. japonica TaxID=39947 RepID=Q69R57_ORYSJ|nr:hypothetical protein [Oryza sativa Japonica Group]
MTERRRLLRSLAALALPRRLLHRQRPSVDVRLPASPDIGGFPPSKPFLIALPSFSSARVSAPALFRYYARNREETAELQTCMNLWLA